MKYSYFLSLLLVLVTSFGIRAQESDPNRMLVVDPTGSYKSYVLGRVQEIQFAKVDGEVACYVQIEDVSTTALKLTTQMSDECRSYSINVVPYVTAVKFSSSTEAIAYMESINSPKYSEDFIGGQLSGIELDPDTEYCVMTVGYDEYYTPCEVEMERFKTPSKPLVGEPTATINVTDQQLTSITATITPNKDVNGFACLIIEKGTLQSTFEMFAPMYGFTNVGQMVQGWGSNESGSRPVSKTFENLDPNTEYEILCQVWDKNGTYAPLVSFATSTLSKGGDGEAFVDVIFGDYKLQDWNGQMLPSQFVTYKPNDQTSRFHFDVRFASEYDANPELYKSEVAKDPEMPTAYYFFFDPFTTDYQINPDTEFVVLVAAKNKNNEWGKVNVARHKTPASAAQAAPSKIISKRVENGNFNEPGKVPAMRRNAPVLTK